MLCIFIHARLRINLWQKAKFINGNTTNSGNSLGGHLMLDCCKALMRGEEGGEKGRQQEVFFPVTLPYIPFHLLLLLQCVQHPVHQGTSVPLRIPSHPFISGNWSKPGCKCAQLFWQHFRIKGKPFLRLLSIVVLIKLNSCGAHMDVIWKSHCSFQIKANREISLLSLSCSS